MNRKLFGKMVCAAAVVLFAGCKDDDEDDILPPDSAVEGLCINEVCSSGTDWVELYNASKESIDLSGYFLQDSKGAEEEYIFPQGTTIAAGEFLALEKDADFPFGISGDGDEIVLLDAEGAVVDRITVPALEDGQTYARGTDGGETWEVKANGTKGASNSSEPIVPGESDLALYINEVCSSGTDWIELYNASGKGIELGGFHLQDDKGAEEEYIFPDGTMITAGGFLVLEKDADFEFGISGDGDNIVVLDAAGVVVDKVEVPALGDGEVYARTGDGGNMWESTTNSTKGASNGTAPSLKGVIVLNEVYLFSDQESKDDLDYIELYNTSSQDIDLSGLRLWREEDQDEVWTFPAGSKIAANDFYVVECDKKSEMFNDPENYPAWGLSKNGDVIVLADNAGELDRVECSYTLRDEAYGRKTDGTGEWIVFAELTKGESNNEAQEKQKPENTLGVYVNEVFTNNQDEQVSSWDDTKDFIELYNTTDQDVDLSGCSLLDDKMDEGDRYTFPEGTVIEANGFLTFDVDKDNTNGPAFGLGKSGDVILLYDKNGNRIDEVGTPDFEDNEIYSVGRKTDGGEEIVVFTEVSKNASNNGKAVVEK